MSKIRQSFCLPMFQSKEKPLEMSLLDLFRKTREIGYEAVEIWMPPANLDEFCATANEGGLGVASMIGHKSLPDGLNKKENHDRIEKELRASIELAKKHRIPGLICFSGNRNEGQTDEEAQEVVAQGLGRVSRIAEDAGVNLNLELLNSKVNHPGYQCDHTAWGVQVVKRVGSPNVKLLYDIYHMQIMEGDLIRTIRENIQWIGHFHTAGNPGRNDLDDLQEIHYRGVCKAIAETGYNLFVGHEFKPKGDLFAALQTAYSVCNL
jgi:hydroxypyruvate isomerase